MRAYIHIMHALSSSTVLPPNCDHSTGAMTVYCYSCKMWISNWENLKYHKKGNKHKKTCRANWARMVLTLQELAEEAQEKLIIDYLIAASLSKACSKFVAKYKPNIKALPQADPKRPPQFSPWHLLSTINSGQLS